MNIFVYTLGCRLNQCESEAVAQAFLNAGHTVLNSHEGADLVIVNTCTVTTKAEQKARRVIRIFARNAVTLVTGCYAQVNPQEIEALSPNAAVLPLIRKQELLKLPLFLQEHSGSLSERIKAFCSVRTAPAPSGSVFDYAAADFSYHCRSYLKVQDGCDNACGFCRVHIARGKSTFLDTETAVQRALEIERNGYHEIVLTGVNLTMYDHLGRGLGGLLQALLSKLGPDMRIRLSSLEPDNINELLLEQIADPRVQPYFHIPIQSAADKVIKRIQRPYSPEHLEYVIKKLREAKTDPFLACDIITGLPAEGSAEFEETKTFIEQQHFALLHVFPFSPRPDTPLYNAKDRATESVRDARAAVLRELSAGLYKAYEQRQTGSTAEVIVENRRNGIWHGLTGNYLRVEISDTPARTAPGDLLKVRITAPGQAVYLTL